MRVLFSFPHGLGTPGIGWTAWNQVDSLIRAGHEVHVVTGRLVRPVEGAASVTTSLAVGGLRVPHRALGRERAFRWHDRVARARLRRTAVDVVHLWPLAPGLTAAEARARGIAAVREAPNTHTRHAWDVVAAEVDRLGLTGVDSTAHTENLSHLAMEQAEWDAVTGVLAPSDAVADSFVAQGFDPSRVFRHRYGYHPGTRRPAPRAATVPLRAVYVGLAEPRKGLHFALDAWLASRASEEGTFTVIGKVLPGYAGHLGDRLRHPSVRVVGFRDDIPAALAASDVLMLPTIEEGSALVTYEAQAMGAVPLVSTSAGALIDDGVHGLLHAPGDVAALSAQLDRLESDRGELARLRANALAHAGQLTWDAAAERLVEAYRDAVLLAKGVPDAVAV